VCIIGDYPKDLHCHREPDAGGLPSEGLAKEDGDPHPLDVKLSACGLGSFVALCLAMTTFVTPSRNVQ
jgi:hypothetical protein